MIPAHGDSFLYRHVSKDVFMSTSYYVLPFRHKNKTKAVFHFCRQWTAGGGFDILTQFHNKVFIDT
jgi:hypothetical protein